MRTKLLTVLLALLVVAAACGSDSDGAGGGDDGEMVEAIAAAMKADPEFGAFVGDDQAECVARGVVDGVGGADALRDAGIEPEDFGDEEFDPEAAGLDIGETEAKAIYDSIIGCDIDFVELMVAGMAEEGAELSAEGEACLRENLDTSVFEGPVVAALSGEELDLSSDEGFLSAMFKLLGECPELAEAAGIG